MTRFCSITQSPWVFLKAQGRTLLIADQPRPVCRFAQPGPAFTPERGKVLPRRTSGVCAIHQRELVEAIKRARNIALLPFATD